MNFFPELSEYLHAKIFDADDHMLCVSDDHMTQMCFHHLPHHTPHEQENMFQKNRGERSVLQFRGAMLKNIGEDVFVLTCKN